MRILLANKFFYPRGGAERFHFTLSRLLRQRGHQVCHLAMQHPNNRPGLDRHLFVSEVDLRQPASAREALRAGARLFHSPEVGRSVRRLVARTRPELAILNNTYHQLGPTLPLELDRLKIPMIMVLHDYKVVCPAYTLFRAGRPCEECAHGRFHQSFTNRCGGSAGRSLLLAAEAWWRHRFARVYQRIDRYISPSRFLAGKLQQMGFPHPVEHLPYPLEVPAQAVDPAAGRAIGYAGRLSHEKGLFVLLRAARMLPHVPFRIAGTGPLRPALEAYIAAEGLEHVELLGHLDTAGLQAEMAGWRAAVIPSVWYENFPYAVLEALALGVPVVGSDIGGIPEQLASAGLLAEPGNAEVLAEAIECLWSDPGRAGELGQAGREFVRQACHPDRYCDRLLAGPGANPAASAPAASTSLPT